MKIIKGKQDKELTPNGCQRPVIWGFYMHQSIKKYKNRMAK
jgi:hypothetical protein